jgi:hypothetical protein
MKLVPERTKFYETLALGNSTADMERFVAEFSPILEENHKFLVSSFEIYGQFLCHFFSFVVLMMH